MASCAELCDVEMRLAAKRQGIDLARVTLVVASEDSDGAAAPLLEEDSAAAAAGPASPKSPSRREDMANPRLRTRFSSRASAVDVHQEVPTLLLVIVDVLCPSSLPPCS